MPAAKSQAEKKENCVMVRYTDAEICLLDAAYKASGHSDRSAYVRETSIARARGAQAVLPKGAPALFRETSEALGVWKAMGPNVLPVTEAETMGKPKPKTRKKAKSTRKSNPRVKLEWKTKKETPVSENQTLEEKFAGAGLDLTTEAQGI